MKYIVIGYLDYTSQRQLLINRAGTSDLRAILTSVGKGP